MTRLPSTVTLAASLCALAGFGLVAPSIAQPVAPLRAPSQAASPVVPALPAKDKPPPFEPSKIVNSSLDAVLLYQLLISEVQARQGDLGTAYQLYFDAARRHKNSQLFQRSVDIALQARAGDQALAAAKAWRQALPEQREASEYTAQILMALGRTDDLPDPLQSLIRLASPEQRPQILASLPRSLSRLTDRKAAAKVVDEATRPWREPLPGMAEAWAASSEAWLSAGDAPRATAALQRARQANPKLLAVGLLALDLMAVSPDMEAIVRGQLAANPAPLLRLAYSRKLAATRRMPEAAEQLEAMVAAHPDHIGSWLTLGAVRLELGQADAAEAALKRFFDLHAAKPAEPAGSDPAAALVDVDQGYLLMAQVSELRKQLPLADDWLRKADPKGEKLAIQTARAKLLAVQGKLAQARALINALPETEPRDALAKITAEVMLLRDARKFEDALKLLTKASERFADDVDLLYDRAMLSEKLGRFDDSERLLRRVIELKADHPNAYNALGYSLADRGLKLDEARSLILKALELRPGDPFITDSLGWLEFRTGRIDEALKWLRQAYVAKADAEIAAHLGEVLWGQGQRDEALRIWREGLASDASNETLVETLKRLQVKP